jgi:myo-inositol-1(or 4)-monophosphatase
MGDSEQAERELLEVAHAAARAAAAELLERFGRRAEGVRAKSGPTDLVSDADMAAEAAVRDVLAQRRPDDRILGEEGGASGDGRLQWVVDPLDGTINFLFGIPAFAVSIACEDERGAIVGLVLDPVRDECFTATRSLGAELGGEPIRGSERDDLGTALVATGFNYDAGVRTLQAQVVTRVLPRVRDIRRVGAAALDLCWTACGRYDAFYERGIHAWDIAAGSLIASRAGLTVEELAPTDAEPAGVIAAPERLIGELRELVVGHWCPDS